MVRHMVRAFNVWLIVFFVLGSEKIGEGSKMWTESSLSRCWKTIEIT